MIRVLIVHENPLFRVGLCAVLSRHEEMQIVGSVSGITDLEQLLELTAMRRPDVVLFDGAVTSCQPACGAVEVVAEVRRAGARGILVFAPSGGEETLFRFFVSGAAAIVPPTISGDDLVEKIGRLAQGEYLISSEILRLLPTPSLQEIPIVAHCEQEGSIPDGKQGKRHDPSWVSDREIAVLKLIMEGCSNKQVALKLGISHQTVKNHMTSIMKKLQTNDRTAAVMIALRRGLISLEGVSSYRWVLDRPAGTQRAAHFIEPRTVAEPCGPLSSAIGAHA